MALTDKLTAIADAIRSKSGKTAKIPLADMPAEIINLQSLNFEVMAYKNASELPATAAVNTIAVFTESMTGYSFDPTEPANPKEGLVWFKTGKYSHVAFDAVEDNPIRICPIGVYQYVGGAYKEIEAKTYRDGWIDWKFDLYLIQNGVYNEETFGKLTSYNAVVNASGIKIATNQNLEVSNFVDFTKYGSVEIDVKIYQYGRLHIHFLDSAGTKVREVTFNMSGTGKAVADMTNVNGTYRIKIYGHSAVNDTNYIVFDNMRFIPQ
jgi:hypothetical protein